MDIDRIKNFFIFHVEKMIVAVVVAASVLLVYQGLNQPNILEKVQPDRLTADANQVRADLDENHNDAIIPERIPNFSIVERTDKTLEKVNPSLYALRHTWDVVESSGMTRRTDPVLFRPKQVQVKGVITTIAMRNPEDEYVIKDFEPADPVEKVVKVRKKSRREIRMESMMGDEEEDYEEEDYDMFDSGMLDPSLTEAAVPVRKFDAAGDDGFRPTTTKHIQNEATQYPVPSLGWFIAGTAVVPHKMMHESFEHSLKDAEGYDYLNRDRPIYRGYQLQRADVTDKSVDQLAEEDWVTRDGDRQVTIDAIVYWSGVAAELVPSDYRDVTLTMWVPPVLLDDYSTYTLHPLIPMMPKAEIDEKENVVEVSGGADVNLEDLIFKSDEMIELEKSKTGMPMFAETTSYGMMPIPDPAEYKMVRFYDFATDPRGDKNAPKPGRKYVYRVRVSIDDPNFPSNFSLQPELKTLHPEAHGRVKELLALARTAQDRQYQRWTEWSDPSDPVSLPGLGEHYLGKVESKAARPVQVGNRTVDFEASPPTAKMVISQFSNEVKTRVPMMVDVTEGSVLSAEADFADVIDPIKLEIRKFQYVDEEGEPIPDKKVRVVSGATVIDINGGAKLDIDSGDGMTEPGYILMFDPDGGLTVKPEIEEQRKYRIYSFADERGE